MHKHNVSLSKLDKIVTGGPSALQINTDKIRFHLKDYFLKQHERF